jgi:hypothetical protein
VLVIVRSVLALAASIAGGLAGLIVGFVVAGVLVVGDLTQATVEVGGLTWFEGESSGSELAENPTRGVLGVVVVVALAAVGAALGAWAVTGRGYGWPGLLVSLAGALPGGALVAAEAALGVTLLLVGPPVALAALRVRRRART